MHSGIGNKINKLYNVCYFEKVLLSHNSKVFMAAKPEVFIPWWKNWPTVKDDETLSTAQL